MKEYKTENLALCPYLQMQGLKFVRTELGIGKYDKPVVSFVFEDKLGVGKDLELDFVRSEFKKYRDLTGFFRNEIEKLKRKIDRMHLEESRRDDDKYHGEEK